MAPAKQLTTGELAALATQLIQQVQNAPKPAKHLTTEALSERLDVPAETLKDWRRDGRGPAYIRGDSSGHNATVRYRLVDVEAWEKSHLVVPASA